jgi:cell pole-organizing protein PopZ
MTDAPTAPAPDGADPSMEEILASIRRILNEDEAGPQAVDTTEPAAQDDDVLVLDDSMLVQAPEPAMPAAITPIAPGPVAPVLVTPVLVTPVPAALPPAAQPAAAERPSLKTEAKTSSSQVDPQDQSEPMDLLAPEAVAAAATSVGGLMRALAAGRATQVYSGGPTLEDLVRSELRPLLKEWLDTHLPPLVERLVRVEIERVVGRAVP